MPSSEGLEKFGKGAAPPATGTFADLLNWHLKNGTRPNGTPDRPGKFWNNKEFAAKLTLNERVVRNWRKGRNRPNDLQSIERELFGE